MPKTITITRGPRPQNADEVALLLHVALEVWCRDKLKKEHRGDPAFVEQAPALVEAIWCCARGDWRAPVSFDGQEFPAVALVRAYDLHRWVGRRRTACSN